MSQREIVIGPDGSVKPSTDPVEERQTGGGPSVDAETIRTLLRRIGLHPLLGGRDLRGWSLVRGVAVPGQLGQVAGISGTELTLADPADTFWWKAGDTAVASATNGWAVQRAGSATLASVNADAGKLIATVNWTVAIPALAVADFMFVGGPLPDGRTYVQVRHGLAAFPTGLVILGQIGTGVISMMPPSYQTDPSWVALRATAATVADLLFITAQ